MTPITYYDFDIIFSPARGVNKYSARAYDTVGDGSSDFDLAEIVGHITADDEPGQSATEWGLPLTKTQKPLSQQENYYLANRMPPDLAGAKKLGGGLFKSVFKDTLGKVFTLKRGQLRQSKSRLRLRLNLSETPELATLPWEYLYEAELGHFYGQLGDLAIVRYLNSPEPVESLTVEEPLRILVAIASPNGAAELDTSVEREKLRTALEPLIEEGIVSIEFLENITLKTLQDTLQERQQNEPFHIFHFIGHSIFDRGDKKGFLLFEDEDGEGDLVSGERLSTILQGQGLRLVVLNSCEGAISDRYDSYAGVAQTICLTGGIPGVLAMQYTISDQAAIVFAEAFYHALIKNFPIEAALTAARRSIFIDIQDGVEWATPVLYMRSDSGYLFMEKSTGATLSVGPAPTLAASTGSDRVRREIESTMPPEIKDNYDSVFDALCDGQLVFFVGLDANLLDRPSEPDDWDRDKGLPGNLELARHLTRIFKYPLNDNPDLARIAQYSIVSNRTADLDNEISRIFVNDSDKPTNMHFMIAEVAAKIAEEAKKEEPTFLRCTKDALLKRFVVVTTGYDNLFETAFQERVSNFHVLSYAARGSDKGRFLHVEYVNSKPDSSPTVINSPNDYNGLADNNPIILKLPGTVESVSPRFAISEDDFFDYLANRELTRLLPSVIVGKLQKSSLLFLGYSVLSWNMRALLYRIWDDRQAHRESWAVLKEHKTIDEKFWGACKVEPIHFDLKEYISGLHAYLQSALKGGQK